MQSASDVEEEQPRRGRKVVLLVAVGLMVASFVCGYAVAGFSREAVQAQGFAELQSELDCGSDKLRDGERKISRRCRASCRPGETESATAEKNAICSDAGAGKCCKCDNTDGSATCKVSAQSTRSSLGDCGSEGPRTARTISRRCRPGTDKSACKEGETVSTGTSTEAKKCPSKDDAGIETVCCKCDPAAGNCKVSTQSRSDTVEDMNDNKKSELDCGSDKLRDGARKISRRCRASCRAGERETGDADKATICSDAKSGEKCCTCDNTDGTATCEVSKQSTRSSLGDCGSVGPRTARTLSRRCRPGTDKSACKDGEELSKGTGDGAKPCPGKDETGVDTVCCKCDPSTMSCTVSTKSRKDKVALEN